MSIIHEALKKTGQPINKETRITPVGHKKAAGSWRPFVVLAIFLAVTVPFFAGRISNHEKPEMRASHALAQFSVEETPIIPMPFASRAPRNNGRIPFVLSGVVYSGPESYCLINGLVLKQGQKVGGATVESITPDTVTLDLGGEKIALLVTTN